MKRKERTGAHYRTLILEYIAKFNGITRQKINEYMIDEIRGDLSCDEKVVKITTCLTALRRLNKIKNIGTDRKPVWIAM